MAVTVKGIGLWRSEVANEPGALARTLEPLAASRARVCASSWATASPNTRSAPPSKSTRSPAHGDRGSAGSRSRPFGPRVPAGRGRDRPGLGARIGRALADGSVNVAFVIAQVVGRRFSAVIGFADAAAANSATHLVEAAVK